MQTTEGERGWRMERQFPFNFPLQRVKKKHRLHNGHAFLKVCLFPEHSLPGLIHLTHLGQNIPSNSLICYFHSSTMNGGCGWMRMLMEETGDTYCAFELQLRIWDRERETQLKWLKKQQQHSFHTRLCKCSSTASPKQFLFMASNLRYKFPWTCLQKAHDFIYPPLVIHSHRFSVRGWELPKRFPVSLQRWAHPALRFPGCQVSWWAQAGQRRKDYQILSVRGR